ncbi:MAG: hypothetical protein A3K04_00240 [Gallionellales bacterium RBG_16_56_9]|nr:MAG: hypothetical protein A3K04_00240 [Gallionellales bacterium RBG_16_56_9]
MQAIEQCTQLLMICQCAFDKRLRFCAVQQRQQRHFLELKVRLQFIRECLDCLLAGSSHHFLIA